MDLGDVQVLVWVAGRVPTRGTPTGEGMDSGSGGRDDGWRGLEEGYGVYFDGPAVSEADFFEEQSGFVAADEDLPAVAALDPGDEAGDGAEDFGLGKAEPVTLVAEGQGDTIGLRLGFFGVDLGMGEPGEPGEGGVAVLESVVDFLAGESLIVVGGDGADGVVLGVEGLDDDAPAARAPARPSGDLCKHLEDAFAGAVVGEVDADVGAHDAHEGDLGQVKALGHHLGADEDVDLAGLELA